MDDFDLKKLSEKMMAGSMKEDNQYRKKKSYKQDGYKQKNLDKTTETGQEDAKYVGAPYNFIPFSREVIKYPQEKLTRHNEISEELFSGEISYEITAETPILVGSGNGEEQNVLFHKDARGRYAIPGSTMRGLIRNNVQILGLCSFYDDIDDYALMYRVVAASKNNKKKKEEQKKYEDILGADFLPIEGEKNSYRIGILKNVRAGYIKNVDGKYKIYQTGVSAKKINYYALSERKIVNDYFESEKKGREFYFPYFMQNGNSIMQHEFQTFTRKQKGEMVHYKGQKNDSYKPYYAPISYKVENDKDILAVDKPEVYEKSGYVMSTGKMNEKKVIYIIPEMDETKEPIEISEEDIRSFQIDIEKRKNTLKQFGGREFFDLPEEGEGIKPVFYIQYGGRLYFGFTPRLRLFYEYMVKDGLKQPSGILDYSKSIFGYSNEEGSYKSKVSFSDAVILGDNESAEAEEEVSLVLAEPKPTSYMDYVKGKDGAAMTYNDGDFELRGVKQYWLHRGTVPGNISNDNKNVRTVLYPLKQRTHFAGKIRFQNLREDEMGLLLWSIRLEKNSHMNVGKAKAYGYGNVSLCLKEVKRLDVKKAYHTNGTLDLSPWAEPWGEQKIEALIQKYKDTINQNFKTTEIDKMPHIKDFFAMKNADLIPPDQLIRYMSIADNEYQSREGLLDTVETVIKKAEKRENR